MLTLILNGIKKKKICLSDTHGGGPQITCSAVALKAVEPCASHQPRADQIMLLLGLASVLAMITSQSTYGMANNAKLQISRQEWSAC